MTTNPVQRNTAAVVTFYQNNGPGVSPTPIALTSPRCLVDEITQAVSPDFGNAKLTLYFGTALTNVSTSNIRYPIIENYSPDILDSLRSAWIVIQVPISDGNNTNTINSGNTEFIQPIPDTPVTNIDASAPNEYVVVFAGMITNIAQRYGNNYQSAQIEATDFGGFLNIRQWLALPKIIASDESGQSNAFVQFTNLPDFNQHILNASQPNKMTGAKVNIPYILPDYNITVNCTAFNGADPQSNEGNNRDYWSNLDIGTLVIDYVNSWYADLLSGIGITLAINDTTGNCDNIHDTFTARNSFWGVLCDAFNRKRSLFTWWSYDGTPGDLVITLNIGFESNTTVSGFNGLSTFDYTADVDAPINYYSNPPDIQSSSADDFNTVLVCTQPCNIVYTFCLGDFLQGWSDVIPTNDGTGAGIAQPEFNRFILDCDSLNLISSSGIVLADGQSWAGESWVVGNTPIGVFLNTDTVTLEMIESNDYNSFVPFDRTIQIASKIPFCLEDGAGVQNTESPALFFYNDSGTGSIYSFYSNDKDIDDLPDSLHPHMHLNTINFNLQDDVTFFSDHSTDNYYITLMVEDTPPLFYMAQKSILNNEASVLTVIHEIKPTIALNNSIIGIDENQKPILVDVSSTGVGIVINNDGGLTLQQINDDLVRIANFWLKVKNKCQYSIVFIDPDMSNLGGWLTNIDVPVIGSTLTGIGSFQTIEVNSVLTKIVWNFREQTTTYYTDFKGQSKAD